MILWLDLAAGPAAQMSRDARMLARAEREPGWEPVLRVFRFDPQGITVGYAQRPERELDLERCGRDGVPWAVRPTGGRAIFHAEEWTYSLAARLDDPRWGGSLEAAYLAIADLLVATLRRLGVPAEHAARRPTGEGPALALGAAVAAPCFASTARHEIVLEGKKLVGSAQRRTASALLQQGSILLGSGHERLADYLAVPEPRRAALRQGLLEQVATAGAAPGPGRSITRLEAALALELGAGVRRFDATEGASWLATAGADPTPSLPEFRHSTTVDAPC
jgi:lipoate-protein ligase A